MALAIRKSTFSILATARCIVPREFRGLSSLPETKEDVAQDVAKRSTGRKIRFQNPALEYRHVYPEFLPDPNPKWRNTLREKMERADMLKRRSQIDIPEFYVACENQSVTDLYRTYKTLTYIYPVSSPTSFEPFIRVSGTGIISRTGSVAHYSLDEGPPKGSKLVSDDTRYIYVKLKPKPWLERWERQELKGVANIDEHLKEKDKVRRELRKTPWEKYDLMKQYRKTIPAEDQNEIWGEVHNQLNQLRLSRKKMFKKRPVSAPKTQLA
ncbi:39S ribosomal protein L19, mitochondrial [Papilio machaon]|uniref:39S ribosomal protein L19, mitochondrial n=1 Tax=Papilio machaon TaxID=76193 RepID=A0A194RJA3_PAPMA|nr:39S ribosomal protein L19, mitochondrial [Papilio machaon]